MMSSVTNKITSKHLCKNAIVYIRQSTLRQVLEHKESTDRQYNLAVRARDLGWADENIVIIDEDQGMSGASSGKRSGFKHLTVEVALGNVGAVFGLEVSRLARACSDWYRLLELCTFTATLIIDDDGIYDPNDFNDRLVLGLKGTMSEAELHFLKSRMYGGKLNRARKGEYCFCLPVGLAYDSEKSIILEPDQQVQDSFKLLFEKFRQIKSARGVVRYFRQHKLLFPGREKNGVMNSPIKWDHLSHGRVSNILKNPLYAGTYAFGRRVSIRDIDGNYKTKGEPIEGWKVLIKDHHPGYIAWDEYLNNLEQLKMNNSKQGNTEHPGLVREGTALLQGIVYCGVCGRRMSVSYANWQQRKVVYYCCEYERSKLCGKSCQFMKGNEIDRAVGDLFLQAVEANKLNIAIRAIEKLNHEKKTLFKQLERKLERAKYNAERSKRQYDTCEPENRLVARILETEWNQNLGIVETIKAEIEELKANKAFQLTDKQKEQIEHLTSDLPRIWYNQKTNFSDRKRLLRILVSDVTLQRNGLTVKVAVRWKTGTISDLQVTLPEKEFDRVRTPSKVIDMIRKLAPDHTDTQIAETLNQTGLLSGTGKKFTKKMIKWLRNDREIPSGCPESPNRIILKRGDGLYSTRGLAQLLGITIHQVHYLREKGIIAGHHAYEGGGYWYNISNEKVKELKRDCNRQNKDVRTL